jgi:hypothetical protein
MTQPNPTTPMDWLAFTQWVCTAIVIPLCVYAGARIERRLSANAAAKKERLSTIQFLMGLPPNAKRLLEDCHMKRSHTQIGDPNIPIIKYMIERCILVVGPSEGGRFIAQHYITVPQHIWVLIPDWLAAEDAISSKSSDPVKQKHLPPPTTKMA